MALFLLYAEQPGLFGAGDAPGWVTEWLESRTGRMEKQARKKEEKPDAPVDAAAQERRQANRLERVSGGLDELELWLSDVVRAGIASAPSQPYGFWDKPAARLVDAQAPGMARMVRQLAGIASSGQGWAERLLAQLGRIQLLVEAFRNRDVLPVDLQADIDSLLGFTVSKEEVLATVPVHDRWVVAGSQVEEDLEGMRVSKSWLHGLNSNRFALVLNFTHRSQATDQIAQFPVGRVFEADAHYYPSATPLRVLLGERSDAKTAPSLGENSSLSMVLSQWQAAAARNPWLWQLPVFVRNVTPVRNGETWMVRDDTGSALLVSSVFSAGWQLLGWSGGRPVDLFVLFDGASFLPMTIFAEGRMVDLAGSRS